MNRACIHCLICDKFEPFQRDRQKKIRVPKELNEQEISIMDKALEIVSNVFEVEKKLIKSKRRTDKIVFIRYAFEYLLRDYGYTLERIAKYLNTDHSTILKGVNNAKLLINTKQDFKLKIGICLNLFKKEYD